MCGCVAVQLCDHVTVSLDLLEGGITFNLTSCKPPSSIPVVVVKNNESQLVIAYTHQSISPTLH